jgi:hypothetical protein
MSRVEAGRFGSGLHRQSFLPGCFQLGEFSRDLLADLA